jgi:CRISPR-associated protein Cmr1
MYEPPKTITIPLKTLTPLWTGGATAGKVDRLRETGIIGSMRWWLEVLVRGVGGCVSDPVGVGKAGLDLKMYHKLSEEEKRNRLILREAGLCDVSYIFGATNWKRRFRLEIVDDRTLHDRNVSSIALEDRKYQKEQRNGNQETKTPKWYFPTNERDKPRSGTFALKIVPLDSRFDPRIIEGLIQFMADWAALGSRPQMGFGVIELLAGRNDRQALFDYLKGLAGDHSYPGYPSLKDCFFIKLRKKDGSKFNKNVTFLIKCDLRRKFTDKALRHNMMGSIDDGQKLASKIKISREYPCNDSTNIRIWGWIPSDIEESRRREIWNIISSFIDESSLEVVDMHTLFESTGNQNGDIMILLMQLFGINQLQEENHA